ncbi:MAG: DUF5654 family protein [Candidatus Aenigmarchaeota archaeon]|nr:DUF5654 family protein [Candidatus Aenigmarchaeota archaeon]
MAIDEKMQEMSSFRTLFMSSIVTALALVVGLFWNDAIKTTIDQIVPQGDSLFYKYLAAIIVTLVVAILVYIVMQGHKAAEKRLKKLKEQAASAKKP